jgi:hypothetical protein
MNSSLASRSQPSSSAPWWLHRCSATSRWRSLLYLQGGTAALIATSKLVETEIKATPDFSQGLVVGLAIAAVFLVGMRQRSTS